MDDARDALLAANAAFYAAFNARDATAMAAVWASDDSVTCIHPGWPPLVGREAVLTSWERIFSADAAPTIACREPRAWPSAGGGLVLCYEQLGDQLLVATNLFRHAAGELHLCHHHAGPCAAPAETDPAATRH